MKIGRQTHSSLGRPFQMFSQICTSQNLPEDLLNKEDKILSSKFWTKKCECSVHIFLLSVKISVLEN